MSVEIRPDISNKRDYQISKHRYYELKHFCLQYNEWKEELKDLERSFPKYLLEEQPRQFAVATYSERAIELYERICIVNRTLDSPTIDPNIKTYLREGVINNRSYGYLKTTLGIPYRKEVYYFYYRYFFWLLSKVRN